MGVRYLVSAGAVWVLTDLADRTLVTELSPDQADAHAEVLARMAAVARHRAPLSSLRALLERVGTHPPDSA